MVIGKTELIKLLAEKEVVSPSSAKMQIENVFSVIAEALENNESVRIYGFGTFEPKVRPTREARNPQNGQKIVIPEYKTVSFKVARDLKKRFNQ